MGGWGSSNDYVWYWDRMGLLHRGIEEFFFKGCLKKSLYSGRTLLLCMTFVLITIMSSKHFWLLQCILHQTIVTYAWCIANCSHWNYCIWLQELWEHKLLVLKKFLLFYRSMLRLSSQMQVVIHHRYVTLVWSHFSWRPLYIRNNFKVV